DYGSGVGPGMLPAAVDTYAGREADASWRAGADQSIDQYRKSNLTVNVTDGSGNPLDGALVHVQLTNSSFNFGSAAAGTVLVRDQSSTAATYRANLLSMFNTVTLDNDLKWPGWQSNPQLGLDAANWVVDNGLRLRGHNLVWPSWTYIPSSTGASSGT